MRQKAIPALETLMSAARTIGNPYLERAKKAGRKIVGVLYDEVPEEIISAAGAVPVLLRGTGSDGTELADPYFRELTCGYTRHTFNEILNGKWDFLDGAVIYNSCDHMRRIYDNWVRRPVSPVYSFIYAPKKGGELARRFYAEQIRDFLHRTEERFCVTLNEERLRAAIRLHNEKRRLQRELYAMQKGRRIALTGTELLLVMMAGKSLPVEDYNALLRELIASLKSCAETFEPGVRLLYMGAHADEPLFFETLESGGGQIVVDSTGFGEQSCELDVREDADPFEALVSYYFEETPAVPRKFGTAPARAGHLLRLVKDYAVDGVIVTRLTMCDLWAFEQYMLRPVLEKQGIPSLELETDYILQNRGQLATRIQAFVESIRSSRGS